MRTIISLTAAMGAIALGAATVPSANAADMVPYEQGQAPGPQYYGPPPVAEGYVAPPPVVYGYPPPVAYYDPAYVVWPGPYWRGPYWGGGYWRGYGPRVAYGYGRFGRGWHR